jgi:hypothetical protein
LPDSGGNNSYNFDLASGARQRVWVEAKGDTLGGTISEDSGGATHHTSFRTGSTGFEGGTDITIGTAGRLGVAAGYDRMWFHDSLGGSGHSNAVHASAYGSVTIGKLGLSALASYAHAWQHTVRPTGVGLGYSKSGVSDISGGVQASTVIALGRIVLTPSAGAIISHIDGDSFTEHGTVPAAFLLSGGIRARTFVSPFANFVFSQSFTTARGLTIVPEASAGFRRNSAATGSAVTLVAQDNTVFAGNRAGLSGNSILVGAGLTASRNNVTIYAKYRGQLASGWNDHSGSIGLRLAF